MTSDCKTTPAFIMACTGESAQVEMCAFSELIESLDNLEAQRSSGHLSFANYEALREQTIAQNRTTWGSFNFNSR